MDKFCFFGNGNFPLVDIVNLASQSQGSFANRKTVTSSTPQLPDFRPHSKLTKLKLATLVRVMVVAAVVETAGFFVMNKVCYKEKWWLTSDECPRGWRLPDFWCILGGSCPPLRYM